MGYLYERTGAWTVPLLCLLTVLVPLCVAAVYVSRPQLIEDHLVA